MNGTWKWYLTVAAIRQWMDITGRTGELEEHNPAFRAAQDELGELSQVATLALDASDKKESGASVYRGKVTVRGKRRRAECTVMSPLRPEGDKPQLVRVTLK